MVIKKCLYIIVFCAASLNVMAQNTDDLSFEKVSCEFRDRINLLNDCIFCITNTHVGKEEKEKYIAKALSLFISNGDSYEEDGEVKKGATITLQLSGRGVKVLPVKGYLQGAAHNVYPKMVVNAGDFPTEIDASSLRQIKDSLYVCTGYVNRSFIGIKDGSPTYRDVTRKQMKLYLRAEKTKNSIKYIPLLYNIYVTIAN